MLRFRKLLGYLMSNDSLTLGCLNMLRNGFGYPMDGGKEGVRCRDTIVDALDGGDTNGWIYGEGRVQWSSDTYALCQVIMIAFF